MKKRKRNNYHIKKSSRQKINNNKNSSSSKLLGVSPLKKYGFEYNTIKIRQNIRGLSIRDGEIHADEKFRVLLKPSRNTIELYGSIKEDFVYSNGNGVGKGTRFISKSKISYDRQKDVLYEAYVPREWFSKESKTFTLPQEPSDGETCMRLRNTISLEHIYVYDNCSIEYISKDSIISYKPLSIELYHNSSINCYLSTTSLNITLKHNASIKANKKIDLLPNSPCCDSTVKNLTLTLQDNSSASGISVEFFLKMLIKSKNAKCKITALNDCKVEKQLFGTAETTPSECKIIKAETVETPTQSNETLLSNDITSSSHIQPGMNSFTTTTAYIPQGAILQTSNDPLDALRRVLQLMAYESFDRNLGGHDPVDFPSNNIQNVINLTFEENNNEPSEDFTDSFKIKDKEKLKNLKFELKGHLKRKDIEKTTEEQLECKICFTNVACVLLIPCSHYVFCNECAEASQVNVDKCPICRTKIDMATIPYDQENINK